MGLVVLGMKRTATAEEDTELPSDWKLTKSGC